MLLPPILYEDDALIAFDKPSGVAVSSDRIDRAPGNLMVAVRSALGPEVANVHRLDAAASGVLLCAKTKPALDMLSGQFQSKRVEKVYLALVAMLPPVADAPGDAWVRDPAGGLPAEFTVELGLDEDEHQRGRMRVFRQRGGMASETTFRRLEAFGRFVWLECRPATGRVHQVRAHLAAVGAPVLYDAIYGDPGAPLLLSDLKRNYKGREDERPLIGRLALHASELGVLHPTTRAPLRIAAPLPKEFEIALKYLRRFPAEGLRPRHSR